MYYECQAKGYFTITNKNDTYEYQTKQYRCQETTILMNVRQKWI